MAAAAGAPCETAFAPAGGYGEHTLIGKNVAHAAFEPREEVLQRVDRNVLLAHFETLKR